MWNSCGIRVLRDWELGSGGVYAFVLLVIATQKPAFSEESAHDSGSSYLSQLTMRGLKSRTEDGAPTESPRMHPLPKFPI